MDFCIHTGKQCYSGPAALAALVALGKKGRRCRPMVRYRCRHCNTYHLATRRSRRQRWMKSVARREG